MASLLKRNQRKQMRTNPQAELTTGIKHDLELSIEAQDIRPEIDYSHAIELAMNSESYSGLDLLADISLMVSNRCPERSFCEERLSMDSDNHPGINILNAEKSSVNQNVCPEIIQ
ncbi:hypothetical protein DMENIID0001_095990 [Sergentomyia squamirostris]